MATLALCSNIVLQHCNRPSCSVRSLGGPHIYTPTRRAWAWTNKTGLAYGPAWSAANCSKLQRDTPTAWLCTVLQIRPVCDHPGYYIRQPLSYFFRPPLRCVCVYHTYGVSTSVARARGRGGTPPVNTPPAGLGSNPIRTPQVYSLSWCPRKLP